MTSRTNLTWFLAIATILIASPLASGNAFAESDDDQHDGKVSKRNNVWTGDGPPISKLGHKNDLYIDNSSPNHTVYEKISKTSWTLIGDYMGGIGPVGPQGPAGTNGLDGATGPQGPKGDTGDIGPIGLEGPMGPIGLEGPMGPIGLEGPMGPIGLEGPMGPIGLEGPMGLTGPQGPKGDTGDIGPQGPIGPGGICHVEQVDTNIIISCNDGSSVTFPIPQ